MIRSIRWIFAILLVPALMAVTSTSSASAEPEDPNNAYEVYEGAFKGPLDVLNNDGFTAEDNAWVCRAEQPDPNLAYVDVYNGQLSVYLSYDAVPGTVFSFAYYGCNEDMTMIVPATVTITVLDVLKPKVTKTGEPRQVKFRNPNATDSIDCLYGLFSNPQPDGHVVVGASSAKTKLMKANRKRIDWVCYLGPDYVFAGDGHVRRIPQGDGVAKVVASRPVSSALIERWRTHAQR